MKLIGYCETCAGSLALDKEGTLACMCMKLKDTEYKEDRKIDTLTTPSRTGIFIVGKKFGCVHYEKEEVKDGS